MTPPLALRALFALVPVAPFLPPLLAHVPVLGALGGVLDGWFGFQCERDPARTFAGAAVCVRCLGIYVGFGLGGAVNLPRPSLRGLVAWIAVATLAIVLDVASEAWGFRPASAGLRLVTGFALAYPIGMLVMRALTSPS
jgi:uncharacterized membrane protein